MNKKIVKQLENKDFVRKLLSLKNDNDVKRLFNRQGIEVSDKELNELREIFFTVTQSVESMTESDLEKIAGGEVLFSKYFRQAGEHYGIDRGGTQPVPGPWYYFGYGGTPGKPGTMGTPLGNFLYNNSNELALVSIAGATAVTVLAATYAINKGKSWYQNKNASTDTDEEYE